MVSFDDNNRFVFLDENEALDSGVLRGVANQIGSNFCDANFSPSCVENDIFGLRQCALYLVLYGALAVSCWAFNLPAYIFDAAVWGVDI